jgi:hypothetical protein
LVYDLLFRVSAETMLTIAADPRASGCPKALSHAEALATGNALTRK